MSGSCNAFLSISSRSELASYLGLTEQQLAFYAFSGKRFYNSYRIPKADGRGTRRIDAPHKNLRDIQRLLTVEFERVYIPTDAAYGFVSGRSIASNAAWHTKKRWVARIDLKDFFPSISPARIRGLFTSDLFGFNDEVANAITNLVCYRGQLPQGAPTSPILSNMICYKMDKALTTYAHRNCTKYTRYADDLIFSSTKNSAVRAIVIFSDDGRPSASEKLKQIITANGFCINDNKTGLYGKGTRQVVTGVVVNMKCNFRRSDYRYLRSLFHHWDKHGEESAARYYVQSESHQRYRTKLFTKDEDYHEGALRLHVRGILSYYAMIARENKKHSEPLQRLWTRYHDLTKEHVPEMLPERSILLTYVTYSYRRNIGERDEESDCSGSAFALRGMGLITACHCVREVGPIIGTHKDYELIIESLTEDHGTKSVNDPELFDTNVADDWAFAMLPPEFASMPGLEPSTPPVSLQRGERVIAYGYAEGRKQMRRIEARVTEIHNHEIVVDRAFIKGMSGGPVLNTRGYVIGVVTKGSGDQSYDRDGRFLLLTAIPAVAKAVGIYSSQRS